MELSKQLVPMTRRAFRHGIDQARNIEQSRRYDATRQACVVDVFRPFVDARCGANDTYRENDAAREAADRARYPHLFDDYQIAAD